MAQGSPNPAEPSFPHHPLPCSPPPPPAILLPFPQPHMSTTEVTAALLPLPIPPHTLATPQVAAGEAGGLYLFESLPPSPLRSALEPHLPAFVTAATGSDWADQHSVQLAIGGAGTGAPAHYHKAAVNSLIYGQKRWWLWPPAHAQYSAMPVGEWVAAGGPEAATGEGRPPLSCVQRAGDVLYLPDFWGHAVLNQKPSVAVATEILTQRLQFFFAG